METLRGAFVLANAVRPETDDLLRGLGARYELALLSGDNEKERERFRSLFGDDAALHFNQSPLDKLGFIRRLQESGKTVMMVGDGLNDAGALKQSDVGVAVVEKVGAFSPASDVILAAGQVPRLSRILALARRATQIVRLSFGISVLYNARRHQHCRRGHIVAGDLRDPDAVEFGVGRAVRVRRDPPGRKAGRTDEMTIADSRDPN